MTHYQYKREDKQAVKQTALELSAHLHEVTQLSRRLCAAAEPMLAAARTYEEALEQPALTPDELAVVCSNVKSLASKLRSAQQPHQVEYLLDALTAIDKNKKEAA